MPKSNPSTTIIILLLCNFASQAQTYSGRVIDAFTKKPLVSVSIVNVNSGYTTISGSEGQFTLPAKMNELIQFSYVGYSPKKINLNSNIDNIFQIIQLEPIDFELREFIFKEKYTPYQKDSIYRKYTYQKAMDYQRSGGVMSPVSLLAEAISGKSRSMKDFKKTYQFWEEQHFIDSRYTPRLITEQTGLTGDSVAYFKIQYPMPFDYARTASGIEVKMWIRNNYEQWVKSGTPMGSMQLADSLLALPVAKPDGQR